MKKVKLAEIAEIFSGLSYRRYLDDKGIDFHVIVQRSIKKDGELSDFDNLKLSDFKDRYFTRKGDVLMKMPYPYDVVCVKEEGLVVSDRIAIIRVEKGYDPDFIAHMLTNAHIKKQLHELGSSQKLPHTSLKEIKELELVLPDYDTQVKYGELLNTINEKIAEDLKVVEYDRNLKEGILNQLWEAQ
ncbi:restriction endonuclease subunit S [Methanobrevibacter sp.]|uniref:restriction endonuclease subunit S n=1 Tax=Methanobrevibacter sp. TaxID=66852 RepID=UPI00388D0B90